MRIVKRYRICLLILCFLILIPGFGSRSLGAESSMPTVSFRIPSANEEFEMIWNTLKMMPFYNRNGYRVQLPSNEIFQNLARHPQKLQDADQDQLRSLFTHNEYDPNHYQNGLNILMVEETTVKKALVSLSELNEGWGFRLYDHYEVVLTLYGVGGQYHPATGKVTIKTTTKGNFTRQKGVHTVVHEIVHLGIHANIESRYDLRHFESERVVDFICTTHLKTVIPDYQAMSPKNIQLDTCLEADGLHDLPRTIEKYLNGTIAVLKISKVYSGTQAQKLKLKRGDVIYKYDGIRISNSKTLAGIVKKRKDRKKIELVILRNNQVKRFELKGGRLGVNVSETRIAKPGIPIP